MIVQTILPFLIGLTPAEAVTLAAHDVQAMPAAIRPQVRYMSLGELPAAERPDAIKVLTGHCNGLSRQTDITPLAVVPQSGGALLRVVLADYGWAPALWDSLTDPYTTVTVEEDWPGGVWPGDGKTYRRGAFRVQRTALAPWLSEGEHGQRNLAYLVWATQSQRPLVRGRWFFNATAAQADRSPGYYDFLGIKDEKTFQQVIGFDAKLAETFGRELREAVAVSGVGLQPRAIVRHNTLGGGYWRTFDFRKATDKKNPLRILGKEIEAAYDATEQFGHLPNGMWATFLGDGKGKRQDAAPDFIASDSFARGNDRRVHVNVSCLRCHQDGGLQTPEAWTRNLLQSPLVLQGPDYDTIRRLRQQYLKDLQPFLQRDRAVFAEAVKECTGWEPKSYAQKYAAFWEYREDARIDLEWAAKDLCVSVEGLKNAIEFQVKIGQSDTVLASLIAPKERRMAIGIKQWEEVIPLAYTYLTQLKQRYKQ